MHLEVQPIPGRAERTAIERTLLAREAPQPPAYRSAWRRAGLELDRDAYATARPRSSRGASRA